MGVQQRAGDTRTKGGVSGRTRVVVERAGVRGRVRRSGGACSASRAQPVRCRRRGSAAASSSSHHESQNLATACPRCRSAWASPTAFSAPPPCHASTRRHPPFRQCVLPVAGGGGKRKRPAASSCRSSTHQQCGSEDAGHPNGQRRSFGGCRRTDQRLQAAAPLRFGPCASQTQWPTHEPEGWQEGAGTRRGHQHDAARAPQRPRRGGAEDTSHRQNSVHLNGSLNGSFLVGCPERAISRPGFCAVTNPWTRATPVQG